jgi:hypothetical protein
MDAAPLVDAELVLRGHLWADTCRYRDIVRRMLAEMLAAKSDPRRTPGQRCDADRFTEACLCVLGSLTNDKFFGRSNAANVEVLQTAIATVEFALRRLGAPMSSRH